MLLAVHHRVIMHVKSLESNLMEPGLLSGCASSRVYAFQLRPVYVITQSLMHVTASESLVNFETNENQHYKLTADVL